MSGRRELDSAYAFVMRGEGISYRKIGIEIARREGRNQNYLSNSIKHAVDRFKKSLSKDNNDANQC